MTLQRMALVPALVLVLVAAGANKAEGLFGFGGSSSSGSADAKDHPVQPAIPHADGVEVANYADDSLPKIRVNGRVVDLFHGLHFDDILMDTPDEMRPPSVVVFYDSSDKVCMQKYNALDWDNIAETQLPARERVFTARYDMYSAPRRAWYKFTPEMDLKKRFGVTECPQAVFAHRSCSGFTEWCSQGEDPETPGVEIVGCEDFVDHCTDIEKWDGSSTLAAWANDLILKDGEPKISGFLKSYREQGEWILSRERTTCNTHMRNVYMSMAFPAFADQGFKAMKTPKPFQDWLLGFHERNKHKLRTEYWEASSTQMNFHEVVTDFVDMDLERYEKERMANKYLKPLLEEWSGFELELTSFYGIRHYHEGSWLRNHLDRIDTHVLSVTISVEKLMTDKAGDPNKTWPLEVARWNGDHVRYEHPGGTMILYESSKLPHGRPYKNEGPTHLGCFCHFKPVNMHGSDAAAWEKITSVARGNVNKHQTWKRYVATPSVEPENPVFSEVNYGKKSTWKYANNDASEDDVVDTGSVTVMFSNEADRELEIYWVSPDGEFFTQGKIAPGAHYKSHTYIGHEFIFSEIGKETALPGGLFTIEKGQTSYVYGSAVDAERSPSAKKWSRWLKNKQREQEANE